MNRPPITVLTSAERDEIIARYRLRRTIDRAVSYLCAILSVALIGAIAYLIVYPPHWPADPAPTEETANEAEHPGL